MGCEKVLETSGDSRESGLGLKKQELPWILIRKVQHEYCGWEDEWQRWWFEHACVTMASALQMPLWHTWIVWSNAVPGFCLPAPRLAGNFVEIVARNKWIRGGTQRVVIQVGRYLGGSWVYQTSQPKSLRKIISYGVLQGWSEAVRCGGWGSWDMEVGDPREPSWRWRPIRIHTTHQSPILTQTGSTNM